MLALIALKEKVFLSTIIFILETTPIIDVYKAEINGFVTNLQASEPIKGATITFTDTEGEKHTVKTNEDGFFSSDINRFKEYTIRASHDLYDIDEKTSESRLDVQRINFQLQKDKEKIIPGADLAKVLNIPNIYFDFDKSKIRPDAKVELSKIIAAFNLYPQLKLNIRSHTDSRGNDGYNKALSERRALSIFNYLVSKGVDKNRLKYEGLGESELINSCSNGVKCSEANHQKNRRAEFVIWN